MSSSPISSDRFRGILIIIPTRNRSDLAIRAVSSALSAPRELVPSVVVSDNSTEPAHVDFLREFCDRQTDPRLRYIRPPKPLPISDHWEWAMESNLGSTGCSHFMFLADRRLFRTDLFGGLLPILERYPDKVVVSRPEAVADNTHPLRTLYVEHSGRTLLIDAFALADAIARCTNMIEYTPTQMMAVCPVGVAWEVRRNFGAYCGSVSPDYCFGFKVLRVVDQLVIYDQPMTIAYASDRSNGIAFTRQQTNPASQDFLRDYAGAMCKLTLLPTVKTGYNSMYHEYEFVRRESAGRPLPEIDRASYLQLIAWEIAIFVEDPNMRAALLREVAAAGGPRLTLKGSGPVRWVAALLYDTRRRYPVALWRTLPIRVLDLASVRASGLVCRFTAQVWWQLHRRHGFRLPVGMNRVGFRDLDEAIEFLVGRRNPSGGKPLHITRILDALRPSSSRPTYSDVSGSV
jgi:hypothetical protein